MVTLQKWIQPGIVRIVFGWSQRVAVVDHVRQIIMEVRMDLQDQTLWEYIITISIGGQCCG